MHTNNSLNVYELFLHSVVEFRTHKEMMRAYKDLNGMDINGKAIRLEIVSRVVNSSSKMFYWNTIEFLIAATPRSKIRWP